MHVNRSSHSFQNNVLVDGNGRARIADYGLLTTCSDLSGTSYIRSNVRWAAPELFEVPELDTDEACEPKLESDIYSFGCIIYQVCQRRIFCGRVVLICIRFYQVGSRTLIFAATTRSSWPY
jgi:serine/threonine protein kinase